MTTKLVCFTGAGGTGKTSLVGGLADLLKAHGKNVFIHQSITREFYAIRGVSSETDFLKMSPEDRHEFQMALFEYYNSKLVFFINSTDADSENYILSERSVFDHIAYTIYGSRESITSVDIAYMNIRTRDFLDLKPLVMYLPYPTPWDHLGADGFRAREVAKDTIIDALITKQLLMCNCQFVRIPCVELDSRIKLAIPNILAYDNYAVPKSRGVKV
jgi:AAA domain